MAKAYMKDEHCRTRYLQGLYIAIQHPALAADQQIICKLPRVCKAWRSTVQQSNAGLMDAVLCKSKVCRHYPGPSSVSVLLSFSCWLPEHAGLIRSIHFSTTGDSEANTYAMYRRALRGQQRLASCLQAAQAPFSAVAVQGGDPRASCAGAPATTRFQLQSFSCPMLLASPQVISSLPSATLTRLVVSVPSEVTTAWYRTALQRLSNLQSLGFGCSQGIGHSQLQFIQHLTQLTSLTLGRMDDSTALQLLPVQLQVLHLDITQLLADVQPFAMDLSHLTQLQQLTALINGTLAAKSTLPRQLQQLWLQHHGPNVASVLSLAALQQLKQLAISSSFCTAQELLTVTSLLQLQEFKFTCVAIGEDLAVLPVVSKLPTVDLSITCATSDFRDNQLFQSLSALTGLTQLYFQCVSHGYYPESESDNEEPQNEAEGGGMVVQICSTLRHLTNLRDLDMSVAPERPDKLDEDDILRLTTLTKLTRLSLLWGGRVPGAVAVALLGELTGLQHLDWSTLNPREGGRVSAYNAVSHALPVIGKLSGLTSLSLLGLTVCEQRSVTQYLTNLHNLQHLEVVPRVSRQLD